MRFKVYVMIALLAVPNLGAALSDGTTTHCLTVARQYQNNVKLDALDSLFDGTSPGLGVLPAVDLSGKLSGQTRIPREISYTEVMESRPVSVPSLNKGTSSSVDTILESALKLLNSTSIGTMLCHDLGADTCSTESLRQQGISISFSNSMGAELGSTKGKPGSFLWYHYLKGADITVNNDLSRDSPESVAVLLAHELTHARQFKKFNELMFEPTVPDNAYLKELDAEFSSAIAIDELNCAGHMSKYPLWQATAILDKLIWTMFRDKMLDKPMPTQLSIPATGDTLVDRYILQKYGELKRQYLLAPDYTRFIYEAAGVLASNQAQPTMKPPLAGFLGDVLDRVVNYCHKKKTEWFDKRSAILDCYGDGIDALNESCGMRRYNTDTIKVNLAMATTDACAGNVTRGVAAQFRMSGMYLSVADSMSVANSMRSPNRAPQDSCGYRLISSLAITDSPFGSTYFSEMNRRMLDWYISHGFKFPPPADESDEGSSNDSSNSGDAGTSPGGWSGTPGSDWDGNGNSGVEH